MTSAAQRVLTNYELLENIITYMGTPVTGPRQIFVIQRVCKTWEAVIARSNNIQNLTFGRSTVRSLAPSTDKHAGVIYDQNLHLNILWALRPERTLDHPSRGYLQERAVVYGIAVNEQAPTFMREGSCRGLYLTRPPCTIVRIDLRGGQSWDNCTMATIRDANGITLGSLTDVASDIALHRAAEELGDARVVVEFETLLSCPT